MLPGVNQNRLYLTVSPPFPRVSAPLCILLVAPAPSSSSSEMSMKPVVRTFAGVLSFALLIGASRSAAADEANPAPAAAQAQPAATVAQTPTPMPAPAAAPPAQPAPPKYPPFADVTKEMTV